MAASCEFVFMNNLNDVMRLLNIIFIITSISDEWLHQLL
jgi:hypothetical protein